MDIRRRVAERKKEIEQKKKQSPNLPFANGETADTRALESPIVTGDLTNTDPPLQPFLADFDLYLFANGTFYKIYEKFGAHLLEGGVQFTTWAPAAEKISVIGEFNGWQEGKNEMERLNDAGVWSLFIPGLKEGDTYKFSIKSKVDGQYRRKSDPYAFWSELRPKNASIVADLSMYDWKSGRDGAATHLKERSPQTSLYKREPISIYEVHLASWKKDYSKNEWGFMNYRELAHELVKYVKEMGYTHIELMPAMEHPLDISWGYQVTSYYAPTSRYGTPEDFMYFVDYCHQNGIGVILDWVPAHFPTDEHSLAYFDGTQLYAYESTKKGVHRDWGTFIFDYGRNEVQNFLLGSALFWLDKYHVDGLRVDAVASMLYLDYSRKEGEWEPNIHGGRENLEAINFIKHLNDIVHKNFPNALMIAEESTAWPGVSHPLSEGGLGFDMKWNMGWMNDTLSYFKEDPVNRKYHQGKLTFSLWYAFSENFILPLSHDEVVHGKGSLIRKMPGDEWQKFANLRLLIGWMFSHPGKKLNFMTTDVAQFSEWNSEDSCHSERSEEPPGQIPLQKQFHLYMRDLNHLYKSHPALFQLDFDHTGFQWLDFSDAENSIIAFARYSRSARSPNAHQSKILEEPQEILVFTFNMTPVQRDNYRIGVPKPGFYKELLNSNAAEYGGDGTGNMGGKHSEEVPHKEWNNSIEFILPPLSMGVFKRKN
jgi:1,4-alpha-glucan branching enzyme